MPKKVRLCCLMTVLLVSASVLGSLEDFEDDVEEEEARQDEQDDEDDASDDGDDGEGQDEDGGQSLSAALLSLFLDLTVYAWSEHIGSVHYEDYPYAYGSRGFVERTPERHPHVPAQGASSATSSSRRHWFELSGGALTAPGTGFGYTASFEGRITSYIGPSVQFRSMYDAGDYLNVTTAGGDLSLVQTNPVHLSAYLQGAWFHGILTRTGLSTGLRIRSFPAPPISFDVAAGVSVYFGSETV